MKLQALHLLNLLEYARIRGVSQTNLMAPLTTASAELAAPEATVDSAEFYAVLGLVQQELQDPMLGIRLGEFLQLQALGLVFQLSLQATSVAEALFYLKSYMAAGFPLLEVESSMEEDHFMIVLSIPGEERPENSTILENALTIIGRELQYMHGLPFSLQRFSPRYNAAYPQGWQWGANFSLKFGQGVLKASLKNYSHWQLDVLVPAYLRLLEQLRSDGSFTSRLKSCMLSMASPALPSLEAVAETLNLSVRTLQRRLSAEGSNFRDLSNALKKELSLLLIKQQRFRVSDVSEALGFAEPAAFIHSFKRWWGCTPERFRKQAEA